MTERQYAEAGGKKYPLKTAEERAISHPAARSTATPDAVPPSSPDRNVNMNLPRPQGSRTVLLTMLVSFGTFALAGDAGVSKLVRLQGYLGPGATATNAAAREGSINLQSSSVFAPRAIFGWITLFVMLTILSDFDATSELAGAFGMLIMLATLITLGPDALTNLGKLNAVGK